MKNEEILRRFHNGFVNVRRSGSVALPRKGYDVIMRAHKLTV
jgi:hypothetical protein